MPSAFGSFLERLIETGEAILRPGLATAAGDAEAREVLRRAFATHALDVAGPRIPFDPDAAMAAAVLVTHACAVVADPGIAIDGVEKAAATLAKTKRTAAAHLSVDLTLRFAVQLERRARATDPAGRLRAVLTEALRSWPLTGSLADARSTDVEREDLGNLHPGLALLLEERAGART
jgi:hypothetical protein